MSESSRDLDLLEAECLHGLWLQQQAAGPASDEAISAEDLAQVLAEIRGTGVRTPPGKVLKRLNRLCERAFAVASTISRDDGAAGRRHRGFKIASSDKVVKWPATAAFLHLLLHHDLLPIPAPLFITELMEQGFCDHKTGEALTEADFERPISYSIDKGYIEVVKQSNGVLSYNVGERTRHEAHYLRLLGEHAQPGTSR